MARYFWIVFFRLSPSHKHVNIATLARQIFAKHDVSELFCALTYDPNPHFWTEQAHNALGGGLQDLPAQWTGRSVARYQQSMENGGTRRGNGNERMLRLAAALRENLRRRKAQRRARDEEPSPDTSLVEEPTSSPSPQDLDPDADRAHGGRNVN